MIIFWEICGFKTTGQTEVPPLDTRWRLGGRRGLWQQNRKTLLAFCVHFCMWACVHVGLYVWSSATGCAGVASCTQIYCTIRLPLFATMENLRMNWTVIRSKYIWNTYAIFCGQLLKTFFFLLNPKKWTLDVNIYIYEIIYIYIYASCRNWRQTMMDTLISTFYCVGFRNNQNPCFNFLASCPMYLFVPHPPTHTPLPNTQKDFRPFGDLEQSEGRETPKRIHLLNWWLLKQEKLHNNWILYFCCCSKQPVHVL